MKQNPRSFEMASQRLRTLVNSEACLAGQECELQEVYWSINTHLFQLAPLRFKDYESIVKKATQEDASSLQYASNRLKNNDDIVKLAVRKEGLSLQNASDRLKDDEGVIKSAVLQ